MNYYYSHITDKRIAPLHGSQHILVLVSLFFLWPALVNGGAFYFPDTTAYIRGPDAILHHATGWRSDWTQPATIAGRLSGKSSALRMPTTGSDQASSNESMPKISPLRTPAHRTNLRADSKPILLGRSVFYGIIPFTGMALAANWLSILVQALIAGAVVIGLIRHFIDPRQRAFNWTCVGILLLLAATPLPFFTSMLMPDFMAGAAIVAAAALLMGWAREGRAGRMFWFAIITAATLMHSANILILLAIACPALLLATIWRSAATMRGATLVIAGALLGLAGEAAFAHIVTRVTGAPPIRPPFVTARLIEDGPGLAYLDRTCPGSEFLLCRFRSRMPAGSDIFLWSSDPAQGVFKAVPPATQRALSAEQGRFVTAVLTAFPLDVAQAAILATYRQMTLLSLIEFNYSQSDYLRQFPSSPLQSIVNTRAFNGTMPVRMTEILLWPIVIGSIAIVAVSLFLPGRRQTAGYGIAIIAGWLTNNIICGVLSTPHDRYQARVAWVLPLVAALIALKIAMPIITGPPKTFGSKIRKPGST